MDLRDVSIGVIGGGTVGSAIANAYSSHVKSVRVYDRDERKCTHPFALVAACDFIFVCVPTPSDPNTGPLDVKHVDEALGYLCDSHANVILKSTVPIGTTRRLREKYNIPNLVFSPEFLTARTAKMDALMPRVNIVGADSIDTALMTMRLYRERYPGTQVMTMRSREAEAVKLMMNSFFAVKVSFFNEMNAYAEKEGLDWQMIIMGMLADGRICPEHTQVPGPDGKYGFGGECLVKDATCMARQLRDAGALPGLVEITLYRNVVDRKREV